MIGTKERGLFMERFLPSSLISALRHSLRGLSFAASSERAVRQELIVLAVAIPSAFLLSGAGWVRLLLVGSIILTIAVELLNTAIEKLCDRITLDHDPSIGAIKDMGSAAVFCLLILNGLLWGAAALGWIG